MKQTSHCWQSGVAMSVEEPDLEVHAMHSLPVEANCKASRFETGTIAQNWWVLVGTSGFW
jgi:hypothetical protein